MGCGGLRGIKIPKTVTFIDPSAFRDCFSIQSITVAPANKVYHSRGRCLIETATKTLVAGCRSSEIPKDDSVTSIGPFAFSGRMFLKTEIPASITDIDSTAFELDSFICVTVDENNPVYHEDGGCLIETATKTLVAASKNSVIPNDGSVVCIQDYAFLNSRVSRIVIPESVTEIGEFAFSFCDRIREIEADENNPVYRSQSNCLYDSNGTVRLVGYNDSVPEREDVIAIGGGAFQGIFHKKVVIPENIKTIYDGAFMHCPALKKVTIPASVENIGDLAFFKCEDVVIRAPKKSHAAYFATKNSMKLELI